MIVALIGLAILQVVSIVLLAKEVRDVTIENQELRDSNKELLEINYKLTKK